MNLFNLAAKLTLDKKDYEEGVKDAAKEAAKESKSLGSKVGGIFKGAAKAGIAAIGAASAAVGKLLYESVQAYSEYEQLIGGVQKLYGTAGQTLEEYASSIGKTVSEASAEYANLEKAQSIVMKNAAEAYKTAGVSASQYMSQATSFSAALINSLGGDTVKAAELTDVAMRAISDNYNTFGSDMASIQTAFQGFAKQNYTMLDNLKLGYGGTKTEMERLIADANEYAASIGQASDLSIESFADVVQAIELVQQKQGVAGTTAREAATTIQGSLGMAKAAWQNLVAGLSDSEADIGQLSSNLISSLGAVASNIVPVVQQALSGFGTALEQLGPALIDGVVGLITDNLPTLISAALNLITQIVAALKANSDALINAAIEIINVVVDALKDPSGLLTLIDAAFEIVSKLAEGLGKAAPVLIPAITQLLVDLVLKLTDPSNLVMLINAAIAIVTGLANGLIDAIPIIIEALPQIIEAIGLALIEAVPQLLVSLGEMVETIASNLWEMLKTYVFTPFHEHVIMPIDRFFKRIWQIVVDALANMWAKITSIFTQIWGFISNILAKIGNFFSSIWNGIKSFVVNAVTAVWDKITSVFSRIFSVISEPLNKVKTTVSNVFTGIRSTITNVVSNALQWGRDLIGNIVKGIKDKITAVTDAISGVATKIKSYLHFSVPDVGPLSDFDTYAPDMMRLFAEGVTKNAGMVRRAVEDSFDFDDALTYSPTVRYSVDMDRHGGNQNDRYDEIISLLTMYLPQLANSEVRLDTGVLVGELAPGMDVSLGGRRAYAGRGLTA